MYFFVESLSKSLHFQILNTRYGYNVKFFENCKSLLKIKKDIFIRWLFKKLIKAIVANNYI